MREIVLNDGRILTLTGNETPDQINTLKQKLSMMQQPQTYMEQIREGSPQRQQELARIRQQFQAGEITAPEYAFQKFGEAAGNVGDIVGRGIGDVVGGAYGMLPQDVRSGIEQRAQPYIQDIAQVAQRAGDVYGEVKETFPRAMENVEAAANIATLGIPAGIRSKQLAGSLTRTGKATAQKLLPNPKTLSSDDLKATSSALFRQADEKGGVLKPQITNEFVRDVSRELPQTQIGQTVIGETPVARLVDRIQSIKDQPMTLQAAQEIDEALGELAYGSMNPATGQIDKQGRKFLNIQSKFRNAIENAPEQMVVGGKEGFESLKDARKYWATSLRLRDVERAIQKGLGTEQPQTGIKNAFKTLLNSKKIANYSPAEVRAIEVAAQKGILTDILGNFGSRLNPTVTGALVGFGAESPQAGAAAFLAQAGASAGARKAATALQLRKARRVEELIRQRVGNGVSQKYALTPEISQLLKELGIVVTPAGGISAALDQLQALQTEEQ